jgi:hypothetical protein
MNINSASFFQSLADDMNRRPDDFYILGDCDMSAVLVMRSDSGDFAVKVSFAVLACSGVQEVSAADADSSGDYYLDGPLTAWQAMFDNILANGKAVGRQTINSLALLGDDIRLRGTDPMGVDKFSRFNQTLQEYLDGAARTAVAAG